MEIIILLGVGNGSQQIASNGMNIPFLGLMQVSNIRANLSKFFLFFYFL